MKYIVTTKSELDVDSLLITNVDADDFLFEDDYIIFFNYGTFIGQKIYVAALRKEDVISVVG